MRAMTRPVAESHVEIDAPIELVWQVMLDVGAYGSWNPFIHRVDAAREELRVGSAFRLHVRWPEGGGASSGEVVTRLDPPASDGALRRGAWEYEFTGWLARLGLVRATRVQHVEQRDGGPTIWRTREEFRGALAALIPLTKVQAGFDTHAAALKQRAESLARAASPDRAG